MGNAATNRTAIAHLWIADNRYSLYQHREMLTDQIRVFDHLVGGHGTNGDRSIILADIGKATDSSQVDQMSRLRQAQFHGRKQTMTTRQELGFIAILLH